MIALNLRMTSHFNRALQLCSHHPRLILGTTLSLSAAILYLANLKLQIDKTCRHISLSDLPSSSAIQNLVKKARHPVPQSSAGWAWGLERGHISFLSPWSDSSTAPSSSKPGKDGSNHGQQQQQQQQQQQNTYWIPSFLAFEVDLPVKLLSGYTSKTGRSGGETGEIAHLSERFFRAFLEARSEGLEAYLIDRDVPPLTSLTPGRRLFGREKGLGAFLLGTWFDTRDEGKSLREERLPEGGARVPVCESPVNTLRVKWEENDKEAAGAVMYWSVSKKTVDMADNAAVRFGIPWRLIEGGLQEFMVERVDEKRVRLVYVTIEAQGLYPKGVEERDFRKISWLGYWGHAVYGQWLLWKTVKRLEKAQKQRASR